MISAPVFCLKILGRENGPSMLENIDLFPILCLAAESHGSGMRAKPANLSRALAASLKCVLFVKMALGQSLLYIKDQGSLSF